MPPSILITGAAGFIGSRLALSLLSDGIPVTGLDNFDPYYDPAIKNRQIARLQARFPNTFQFIRADITDVHALQAALASAPRPAAVVHLAAKVGVRPSITDPRAYHDTNTGGTQNLLDWARTAGVNRFVFASSSSVYGNNPAFPWKEDDAGTRPISPYAATKLASELMGHAYSHLYGITFTALRFFTVYGPGQRPDLAIHKFARALRQNQPLTLYGDGNSSWRDYTFVDDIVAGIRAALQLEGRPFEIFNLGNSHTLSLIQLVRALEAEFQTEARLTFLPPQPGDVDRTCADITKARTILGYNPQTSLQQGLAAFHRWLDEEEKMAV